MTMEGLLPSALVICAVVVVVLVLVLVAATIVRHRSQRPAAPTRPLAFTPHARERMAERGVTEAQVAATVQRPERMVSTTYVDRHPSRRDDTDDEMIRDSARLEKTFARRLLKVWVPPTWYSDPTAVVKSVAWQELATLSIPPRSTGRVIGRGGENVRAIQQRHGVRIDIDTRTGRVRITGDDRRAVSSAAADVRRSAR